MELILAAVVLIGVFVIAAWVIGREAKSLGSRRYVPTYRIDEAVVYVSDRLPAEITSHLSYEEVRQVLRWHLEFLQGQQIAATRASDADEVVVSDDPGVVHVVERATENDMDVEVEELAVVVGLQVDYLTAIGALIKVEESGS